MPVTWPSKYSKTTNRHNEWAALKKKHAVAIKASKIDFDAGLGTAVDKFENRIKKVAAAHYGDTATLDDLEKVSQAGLDAKKVARDYKTKVSHLPDPAKKELTAFLTEIENDAVAWAGATVTTATPNANWKQADWDAYSRLVGHLAIMVRRGSKAGNAFTSDSRFATSKELKELHQLFEAAYQAAKTAEPVAQQVEKIFINASGNPAYVGVLKAEAAKAVAGPFEKLRHAVENLYGHAETDDFSEEFFRMSPDVELKAVMTVLKPIHNDLIGAEAAERSLKV